MTEQLDLFGGPAVSVPSAVARGPCRWLIPVIRECRRLWPTRSAEPIFAVEVGLPWAGRCSGRGSGGCRSCGPVSSVRWSDSTTLDPRTRRTDNSDRVLDALNEPGWEDPEHDSAPE